jgi:type III secretory pathway component EscS
VRELWIALVATGFVASTLVGFLLSVTQGLFGFQDSWLAPYAKSAFVLEIAALVVLLLASIVIFLDGRTAN